MLSVSEAAEVLGVSNARVRQLIEQGALDATKVGRNWAISEESVLDRLHKNPSAGRPKTKNTPMAYESEGAGKAQSMHEAFISCKQAFSSFPTASVIRSAQSKEELDFYMETWGFFLRQKQAELVKRGVF